MLLKKALGYKSSEVVEEYVYDKEDGELALSKRKVTYKQVPPDVSATKILLETYAANDGEVLQLTDSQLEEEKQRLIKLLKNYEKNEKEIEDA